MRLEEDEEFLTSLQRLVRSGALSLSPRLMIPSIRSECIDLQRGCFDRMTENEVMLRARILYTAALVMKQGDDLKSAKRCLVAAWRWVLHFVEAGAPYETTPRRRADAVSCTIAILREMADLQLLLDNVTSSFGFAQRAMQTEIANKTLLCIPTSYVEYLSFVSENFEYSAESFRNFLWRCEDNIPFRYIPSVITYVRVVALLARLKGSVHDALGILDVGRRYINRVIRGMGLLDCQHSRQRYQRAIACALHDMLRTRLNISLDDCPDDSLLRMNYYLEYVREVRRRPHMEYAAGCVFEISLRELARIMKDSTHNDSDDMARLDRVEGIARAFLRDQFAWQRIPERFAPEPSKRRQQAASDLFETICNVSRLKGLMREVFINGITAHYLQLARGICDTDGGITSNEHFSRLLDVVRVRLMNDECGIDTIMSKRLLREIESVEVIHHILSTREDTDVSVKKMSLLAIDKLARNYQRHLVPLLVILRSVEMNTMFQDIDL